MKTCGTFPPMPMMICAEQIPSLSGSPKCSAGYARTQLVGAGEHKEGKKRRPHRKPDLFQVWNMEFGVCKEFEPASRPIRRPLSTRTVLALGTLCKRKGRKWDLTISPPKNIFLPSNRPSGRIRPGRLLPAQPLRTRRRGSRPT